MPMTSFLPLLFRSYRYFSGLLLAFCCACFPVAANAQDADSQLWALLTLNKRFNNGLRLYMEAQPRLGSNYSHISQLLIRPAIGYQVSPKLSLWLGYGYTPAFTPKFTNEHRIFQQVLIEDKFPGLNMSNRTRLEERSIAGAGGTSLRLRHQLRISKPLDARRRWAIVGFDEIFINLNDTPSGPESGFDQNRAYIGVAHQVNPTLRLELGYQASSLNPPRNQRDRRLDVLLLGIHYSL